MVIAALICFGLLLAAWIAAPDAPSVHATGTDTAPNFEPELAPAS
jgi:hypothetical protein